MVESVDNKQPKSSAKPEDGHKSDRSSRATGAFKYFNVDLFGKSNVLLIGMSVAVFGMTLGYTSYMKSKYESLGYYITVDKDGQELFKKKKSKWD